MIIDPIRAIPVVAKTMTSSDFLADPSLGQVFDRLVAMHAAGSPVHDLRAVPRMLEAVGVANVKQLVAKAMQIPNVATVEWYARRLNNFARLRAIRFAVADVFDQVAGPKAQADEVLGWLEGQLLKLRHGGGRDAKAFDDIAAEVIADLEQRLASPEPGVLLSGFPSADQVGFVFGAGELTILAARPGIGKTSLATQIALHHSGRNRSTLFASLEMKDKDLIQRVLVSTAGHNHQMIRTSRIDAECVNDIRKARAAINKPPLFVLAPGRVKAAVIHANASVFKATNDLRLLIVDYLGYVRPDDGSKPRYEQVGDSVKALRDIGQALEIPVLCLCQLNREADGPEPKLSNLRESGDIEQDADVVAFLHPPNPKDTTRVDLIVAKNRQGSSGRTSLRWHAAQTMFSELEVRDHANYRTEIDQWNNQP